MIAFCVREKLMTKVILIKPETDARQTARVIAEPKSARVTTHNRNRNFRSCTVHSYHAFSRDLRS